MHLAQSEFKGITPMKQTGWGVVHHFPFFFLSDAGFFQVNVPKPHALPSVAIFSDHIMDVPRNPIWKALCDSHLSFKRTKIGPKLNRSEGLFLALFALSKIKWSVLQLSYCLGDTSYISKAIKTVVSSDEASLK